MTTDGKSIYICDSNGYTIRKVEAPSRAVTTLLGGSAGYADGPAANARFGLPASVTTDGTSLHVADQVNDSIRQFDISNPNVTTDGTSLFLTESSNRDVRKISLTPPYAVSTLADPPPTTRRDISMPRGAPRSSAIPLASSPTGRLLMSPSRPTT